MRRVLLMVLAFVCGAALAAAAQPRPDGGGLGGIDANRDGAITRAEAEAARAALFSQLDGDGDGYLGWTERIAGRVGYLSAHADADGDNRLSPAEFMSQPYRAFERLDADGDSVLSPAELEAARR